MTLVETIAVADAGDGCTLSVKVIPRSSRNQWVGFEQGELKVRIQAPPVEGAANEAILEFLGKCLKRPKGSLSIVSGQRSKHKRIKIAGVKAREVLTAFNQILTGNQDG